jgi:hypothetical protein
LSKLAQGLIEDSEGKQVMRVTDKQAATLRAHLAGDFAAYERLFADLDGNADGQEYSALLTAAFHNAVDLRFTRDSPLGEVIEFIASVRARSGQLRDAVDPHAAERILVAAVGGDHIRDLDPAKSNMLKMILLTSLIADMHLNETGVDELVAKARALADELLR